MIRNSNILVITTDQQAGHLIGNAGNPYLSTPAMDSLVATGTVFRRAYVSNPICVPSRTSYMTGSVPHENGITYNVGRTHFDTRRFPCLGRVLRDAGYSTAHFGKWHVPEPLENQDWSGFEVIGARDDDRPDQNLLGPLFEFLDRQPRDQPFLAFASLVNPHDICHFARTLNGLPDHLPNGEIGKPPGAGELPPLPSNWRPPQKEPSVIRDHYNDPETGRVYPSRAWGGEEDLRWRQYLWGYYRMIELVDAQVGKILGGLEDRGLTEDTLVIFFSDHGDGAARHRWNQKTMFYDECARVPLVLRAPGRKWAGGEESTRLVNIGLDLFPTLLDAAGLPRLSHLRGESFLRNLGDPPTRRFIVAENNLQPSWGKPGPVSGRMVRSTKFKYICYSAGKHPEQLFNMEDDPLEMHNLVDETAYLSVLKSHRSMLDEWITQTNDLFRPSAHLT